MINIKYYMACIPIVSTRLTFRFIVIVTREIFDLTINRPFTFVSHRIVTWEIVTGNLTLEEHVFFLISVYTSVLTIHFHGYQYQYLKLLNDFLILSFYS